MSETPREILQVTIEKLADDFFEFPTKDRQSVTYVSDKLFAEHCLNNLKPLSKEMETAGEIMELLNELDKDGYTIDLEMKVATMYNKLSTLTSSLVMDKYYYGAVSVEGIDTTDDCGISECFEFIVECGCSLLARQEIARKSIVAFSEAWDIDVVFKLTLTFDAFYVTTSDARI